MLDPEKYEVMIIDLVLGWGSIWGRGGFFVVHIYIYILTYVIIYAGSHVLMGVLLSVKCAPYYGDDESEKQSPAVRSFGLPFEKNVLGTPRAQRVRTLVEACRGFLFLKRKSSG